MDEVDLIELFIQECEAAVAGFTDPWPVRTSYTDEDHIPQLVLIDSVDFTRRPMATNPYAKIARTDTGEPLGEELHVYSDVRVDLEVRSENELASKAVRSALKEWFVPYERRPEAFDADVCLFEVGRGGTVSAQFEQTGTRTYRQTQTFSLLVVRRVVQDADVLEAIERNHDIS